MTNNTGSFYTQLSPAEKIAYNSYKDNPYVLNEKLRLGSTLEAHEQMWISSLDSMIRKYQNPEAITLHRAACSNSINGFVQGTQYCYPAYMSTAMRVDDIKSHAVCLSGEPVYFELHIPAEVAMAPMDDNPDFGQSENEMLLGRNCVFEIENESEIVDPTQILAILSYRSRGVQKLIKYVMRFKGYDVC
jgi:hypothetical protein